MKLDEFLKYIRKAGCRTRVYNNKWSIHDINGFFDIDNKSRPFISVALMGHTESGKMELMAHEFGHYLQYMEDVNSEEEEYDCYGLQEKWLAHKIELSPEEIKEIREMILQYEWDADMRAIALAEKLTLEPWNTKNVIKGAKAYNTTIKWSFETRLVTYASAARRNFNSKLLTPEEVIAPMSQEEFKKVNPWVRLRNFCSF